MGSYLGLRQDSQQPIEDGQETDLCSGDSGLSRLGLLDSDRTSTSTRPPDLDLSYEGDVGAL